MDIPSFGLHSLVKGDTVLSFPDKVEKNLPSWSTQLLNKLQSKGKTVEQSCVNPKIGTVILNKEWKDSDFNLLIRWGEDGKFQKLTRYCGTKNVAYSEKVFVLDRSCLGPGARVCLTGHPEIQGTIKGKKYLVTGRCFTEYNNEEVIFEDVDVTYLHPLPDAGKLKYTKILYRSEWIGVITGYKLKLRLSVPNRAPFFLILDSCIVKKYCVGEKILLGHKLLHSARLVGNADLEQNHWLLNSLIFWNVSATITDIETEELHVNWIGKAGDPKLYPTSYNFPNAPKTDICYDDLKCVQYLNAERHCQVVPGSLWMYNHNPDVSGKELPISKKKWHSKWMKLIDLDHWEYPVPEDLSEKYQYWDDDLIMQVICVRSVIEVAWQNGIVSTLNSGDVVPLYLETVWKDWAPFQKGIIVKDKTENKLKEKYGIMLEVNEDETATVKWIVPGLEKSVLMTSEVSNVPLFDLEEMPEYNFLTRVDQSPLVFVAQGDFKLGVVIGADPATGQVRVKCPGIKEKLFWPHQLSHYKCDLITCPMSGCPVAWYDHITTVAELSLIVPTSELDVNANLHPGFQEITKKKLTVVDNVPDDNIFARERPTNNSKNEQCDSCFRGVLEYELRKIGMSVPDGMWIEFYSNPGNVMSVLMIGPSESLFEDVLFIFDIVDFLKFEESHMYFRSMRVTILPEHLCKTGGVHLPEKNRLRQADMTNSDVINTLLKVKDLLGTPLDKIYGFDTERVAEFSLLNGKSKNYKDISKFVLLSLLEYILATLKHPPKSWSNLICSHYQKALPRIISRLKDNQHLLKKPVTETKDGTGDLPKIELDEIELDGGREWSEAFNKSFRRRLRKLEKISEGWNSTQEKHCL